MYKLLHLKPRDDATSTNALSFLGTFEIRTCHGRNTITRIILSKCNATNIFRVLLRRKGPYSNSASVTLRLTIYTYGTGIRDTLLIISTKSLVDGTSNISTIRSQSSKLNGIYISGIFSGLTSSRRQSVTALFFRTLMSNINHLFRVHTSVLQVGSSRAQYQRRIIVSNSTHNMRNF